MVSSASEAACARVWIDGCRGSRLRGSAVDHTTRSGGRAFRASSGGNSKNVTATFGAIDAIVMRVRSLVDGEKPGVRQGDVDRTAGTNAHGQRGGWASRSSTDQPTDRRGQTDKTCTVGQTGRNRGREKKLGRQASRQAGRNIDKPDRLSFRTES